MTHPWPVVDVMSFCNGTGSAAQLARPPILDSSASLSCGIDGAHFILPDQRLFARAVSGRRIPPQGEEDAERRYRSKGKARLTNPKEGNTRQTRSVANKSSRNALGVQKIHGKAASRLSGASRANNQEAGKLTGKTERGQDGRVLTRHGAKFRLQNEADANTQCGSASPGFDDDVNDDNISDDNISDDNDGADDDDNYEDDDDWNASS
jgi:hypothetical protein